MEEHVLTEKKRRNKDDKTGKRGHWRNPFEFLLSTIGYAIGMGNMWRFPYIALRNGGGAFLIPYLLFAVIFGIPLFFMESVLGQYFQRSPILAFDFCPLFKGVAVLMCLLSFLYTIIYVTVLAWTVYFLYSSFSVTLPWTTCDNPWNTNSCLPLGGSHNNSVNVSGLLTTHASEEFWDRNVLGRTSGVENIGTIQPHLALCLFISWCCIFLCIFKGIKSSRIAVYVTATIPFILIVTICSWTATFPGAVDGMLVYIKPRWETMVNYQIWLEASLQVFYSLGPAWGGIITLSSYNPFHHNCIRDSIIVTLVDVFTSIVCGLVIFSGLGYMANQAGVPVLDVVTSGPGLSFVTYPQVVSTMPIPQLWASLFFILIFFLGIDSAFGTIKTMTCGLFDLYPESLGTRKPIVSLIACGSCFLVGLIFVTENRSGHNPDNPGVFGAHAASFGSVFSKGGVYLFQLCDWYLSFFAVMLIALLECLAVSYLYGIDRFLGNVREMLNFVSGWFLVVMKYSLMIAVPLVMAIALVFTVVTFRSPTYGDYVYPDWTNVFGWILGTSITLPIPATMVYQIYRTPGTFQERLRTLMKPKISGRGGHIDEFSGREPEEVLLNHPQKRASPSKHVVARDTTLL